MTHSRFSTAVLRATLAGCLLSSIGCQGPVAPWIPLDGTPVSAWTSEPRRGVVESREYKLMLDRDWFGLDEPWARAVIWGDLATIAQGMDLDVEGDLSLVEDARDVRFYDTPGSCLLNQRGFVLRERVEDDGDVKMTLKYRSPDRYLSAAKDVASHESLNGKTKFEEDISAPFLSRFSHSTKAKVSDGDDGPGPAIDRLAVPLAWFPGVRPYFADVDDATALEVVGATTWNERVFGPASIDLGTREAEVSLTLWGADGGDLPEVVEISFKVEADDEAFDEITSARALALFEALQTHPFVQPDGATKTRTAYDRAPGFCGGL